MYDSYFNVLVFPGLDNMSFVNVNDSNYNTMGTVSCPAITDDD